MPMGWNEARSNRAAASTQITRVTQEVTTITHHAAADAHARAAAYPARYPPPPGRPALEATHASSYGRSRSRAGSQVSRQKQSSRSGGSQVGRNAYAQQAAGFTYGGSQQAASFAHGGGAAAKTFSGFAQSFAAGARPEYGSGTLFQQLRMQLEARSRDPGLHPASWPSHQMNHPHDAYKKLYIPDDALAYPAMPQQAMMSLTRNAAAQNGEAALREHDRQCTEVMVMDMKACPAALLWNLCDIGYNCDGSAHFVPHSEIDMVLAGKRPNGPFIWDRNFHQWHEANDLAPCYGDARHLIHGHSAHDHTQWN